ncbi:hypothetical protein C9I57_10445 [Trinickia symbiotica]|uniref:ABC-type transport auxiliary lipoprotein component domain-containing protein n=1 Tax=Trinickia symbiotica TaxID=863227 RepID=A0A2T3XX85_9BURK|nr:PqiC family protein [Trinickia symbiotica]PTB21116.1 hypothetical protein C9I57_10445 [Trinickia symbiotica]
MKRARAWWTATMRFAAAAMLCATMLAAGCGHSPPTHYFALDAVPASAPIASGPLPPVQLTAVHIPAMVDRPEVVTRVAPNRLTVGDSDRWGAPLGQMMRGVLAQDLYSRLPAGAFVFPDAPAPADTRKLVVTVLDLDADANGALTLQAAWTLMAGRGAQPVLTRETTLATHGSGSGAAAQAAALSRAMGELADRISESIGGH